MQLNGFHRLRHPWSLLCIVLFLLSAATFIYAETMAFVWDEGFHLVAAQLIAWGRTPYIQFAFPQTLLNAYWNAFILKFVGHSWHTIHAFDALFSVAATWLTATYVMRRFPEPRWRLACAVVTACFVALDSVVIAFGPIAQAYATGMLLVTVAFRVAVTGVEHAELRWPFIVGLVASAAAGSTLLPAPAVPIFLIWLLVCGRTGNRLKKFVVFSAGAVIPFIPELLLFVKAPRQTWFNVLQYQALFRRINWGDTNAHDFDVFTDWTVSAQTLLLGLLALIGLVFIIKKSVWPRTIRNEFYLAAWLCVGMGVYISTAHPTFGRYFIFLIPFTAILASAGFFYVSSRLIGPEQPRWPLAVLVFILTISAVKYVFDDRDATNWHDFEKISAKVKEVTKPGEEIFADEMVYFLLRLTPPSGMEFSYSHKLDLPAKEESLYHIVSFAHLKKQVESGRFATFETCKDDVVDDFKLNDYFPNKEDFDDCTVFWRKGKNTNEMRWPTPSMGHRINNVVHTDAHAER